MAKRATVKAVERAMEKIDYKEYLNSVNLSDRQKEFFNAIEKNTITIATGPAGTSKTFTACYAAIKNLSGVSAMNKIIITKPIVEAGENLGFLPGSVDEKISPYMESYVTTFHKIIGKPMFEKLKEVDRIEMRPVAYMRGSTFNNAFMILDEAQNMNFHQLMTYITRLGENSKMVICGDVSQHDIRHNLVALPEFQRMIQDVNNIGTFTFEKKDIVRNKIIIDIVEKYEEWKEKNMQTNENGKGKGNGNKGS
jgi:phosphate starvation-inducible PhoH-like protein